MTCALFTKTSRRAYRVATLCRRRGIWRAPASKSRRPRARARALARLGGDHRRGYDKYRPWSRRRSTARGWVTGGVQIHRTQMYVRAAVRTCMYIVYCICAHTNGERM